MTDLHGKVALVTGGGRGLGEAIVRTLGIAGANVIIGDIRAELAEKVARDMASSGSEGAAVKLDVADETQVRAAISKVRDTYGRLDIVVNNAGVDLTVPFEEMAIEDWDRIVDVNLRGPFLTSNTVFPLMVEQGGGYIVNIVSTAAKRAWANASAYHASKWGLLGLTYALHVEGRPKNIKVTAVVAGGMRTPFLLDRFPDIDVNNLQDPKNVAETVRFVLTQPPESVIPEIMVLPMRETSWP